MKGIAYVLSLILLLVWMEDPAFAYLDPGTGSMILQLLLGGIAGAMVILKLYWRRFVGLFRGNTSEETKNIPSQDQK